MLPFTVDQFLDVFRRYNLAVWPAQPVLVALAVGAVVIAIRDRPNGNRWVSAILALLWLWMAGAYHLAFFAAVNPVANAFAAAFAAQSMLFAWLAFRTPRPSYRPRSWVAAAIGTLFMAYALLVYPVVGYLLGHRYPAAPTFGVPCPTTIFTLGLLVWASGSIPRRLFAIPLAWSVVATSAAVNLGMTEDFGLLAAAVVSVGWLAFSRRGAAADDTARVVAASRQTLLACGILSSVLYAATDVLGGLQYDGYSFTSQAVSELMAIGAPSEDFVDPLFITSGVLVLAFAIGVVREASQVHRVLRITGAALIVYAIAGFTGPTLFEMHPRGFGSMADDMPHIVLTGLLVVLTLLAISFGAFALGHRFRVYSFATIGMMVALGAASGPYGARLAAGQPTPWFGVIERILIYSFMLWFAVLAVALLRRPYRRAAAA